MSDSELCDKSTQKNSKLFGKVQTFFSRGPLRSFPRATVFSLKVKERKVLKQASFFFLFFFSHSCSTETRSLFCSRSSLKGGWDRNKIPLLLHHPSPALRKIAPFIFLHHHHHRYIAFFFIAATSVGLPTDRGEIFFFFSSSSFFICWGEERIYWWCSTASFTPL